MEKGGKLHRFGPGSILGGCRFLLFLGPKKNGRKIGEIAEKSGKVGENPRNGRYFGDFTEIFPKIHQIDYRWRISCRPPPITEKSAKYRRFLAKFCSMPARVLGVIWKPSLVTPFLGFKKKEKPALGTPVSNVLQNTHYFGDFFHFRC